MASQQMQRDAVRILDILLSVVLETCWISAD